MIYCLDDYKSYAEVCFREFGDRVKHWITFNESFSFCQGEYASGVFAPGRFSSWEQGNCSVGIQEQNLTPRAIINCLLTEKPSDCTKRNIRFMNPLIKGDYPLTLRKIVGNRLPKFSKEQSKLVKGAFDFIGLNYYTAYFAENVPPSNNLNFSYNTDPRANLTGARKGVPIGPTASKEPELAKLKEQA